jgi:hypothetical protein
MRRVTALCTAAGIALSAFAVVGPAQAAPYYLIRYDNTGFCQIWDSTLSFKPWTWPSAYRTVSKPIPTVTEALAVKDGLLKRGKCAR